MATREAWERHQENTEVCEKDGKYYLKGHPEHLYNSYKEAKESSDFLRDLLVF